MLELNKIYNQDCLDGMKEIDDQSIDLIFTDLPYGQTQRNKWDCIIPFNQLWEAYERIIKPNGAIILFGNGMFTADLMESNRKLWKYNLIWHKTQPTGFLNAKKMPLRSHEDICVFYKKTPVYNPQKTKGHQRKVSKKEHHVTSKETTNYGEYDFCSYDSTERYPTSILTFAKDTQKSKLHPTQKPLELCKWIINTYSNENMIVLDSCVGSGTIPLAAKQLNRNYIGFENDQSYFQIAKQRLEEWTDFRTQEKIEMRNI